MSTLTDSRSTIDRGTRGDLESTGHERRRHDDAVNVGPGERMMTAVMGGALALAGLTVAGQRRTPGAVLGGVVLAGAGAALLHRGATGYCPAYDAAGVGKDAGRLGNPFTRGVEATAAISIGRPRQDVYAFYRDFTNLPRVMSGIEKVEKLDEDGRRTRWVVNTTPGHVGPSVEWVAVVTDDQPGTRIAWESEEGAVVTTRGHVDFIEEPAGRGTLVRAYAEYKPLGGVLAVALAKATGSNPRGQMQQDLRRLKAYLETGEVPTTEGQPRGNCSCG